MKKWLCLLVAGVLLLSMTACGTQKKQTAHTYSLTLASDDQSAKILIITEKASGKEIQVIRLEGSEWFIEEPIYTDFTFDGNTDILIPYARAASGIFFQGYVWDSTSGKYVYVPSLESLPNIALDAANGMLLSHRTADKITTYGMHKYSAEKKDVIIVRSLHWEPEGNNAGMHLEESQYTDAGKEIQVKKASVPSDGMLGVDKTDTNIAPYYEKGSLWDLDSEKWKNTVYTGNAS